MEERITQVRQYFPKYDIDALFVTNQQNVSYLTSFVGLSPNEREGFFFVTRLHAYLLTFPTYFEMYKNSPAYFTSLNITIERRLKDHLNKIIKKDNVKKIGFEKANITIAELESLKKGTKNDFVATENIVENQRIVKDEKEIEYIRSSARITDQAYEYIKTQIKSSVTEKEIALKLEYFIKSHADDVAFTPIVAFNQNSAIPHYIPSNSQKLIANSLILLDFGSKVKGYCSDMTRVIFFGKPKDEWIKVYNATLKAQNLAINALTAGKKGSEIDLVARNYILNNNYPAYQHGLGHGVGLAIHENPKLKINSDDTLKENMIVTIEPGIYIPGNCGVRIEDLILIKKDGIEILSHAPKTIITL